MPNQADFPPPESWTRVTPKKPRPKKPRRYVVVDGSHGWFFWRVRPGHHRLGRGRSYTRKADAVRGARRALPGLRIVVRD